MAYQTYTALVPSKLTPRTLTISNIVVRQELRCYRGHSALHEKQGRVYIVTGGSSVSAVTPPPHVHPPALDEVVFVRL